MNIKISRNEKNDISRFKNLKKDREKVIQSSFTDQIKWNYKSNELASILHPQEITVVIKEIKEENASTKTFVLEPKNTQEFPPYEAGQYIVLDVRLGDNLYKRAYSISSSPNDFSKYEITIKRVFGG